MREMKMVMSNFIDEDERHAELYGTFTDRQQFVLEVIKILDETEYTNDQLLKSLHVQNIRHTEIEWLKRTGHLLPSYE